MDLVSVIVPVYNVEKYLSICIKSIIGQTYSNLQIILIDDGSPDKSADICDDWSKKDSRITVIHKKNGGLSDARNVGIAHAKGDYVCFVDSDDILAPDYISSLYNAIIKFNVKLSVCDIQCFRDNEINKFVVKEHNIHVFTSEQALADIIHGGKEIRAIACNKMYGKEILQNECFVYGKHHEDEFFTYRIIDKTEKIAYVDAPLYFYRQHEGSIMSTFTIKRLDALEAYLERMQLLKEKYPRLYVEDKISFCISCVGYYRLALKKNNKEMRLVKNKIKALRKNVSFTRQELRRCSLFEKVYIFGSRFFMQIFCTLIQIFRGN